MSNKITIKRSAVPGKIPLPGDLEFGEFAINYADGNLFFKDSSNSVATLASTQFVSVTGNVTAAGNISGNYFIGNGAFLTGISGGGGNGTPLIGTVDDFTGDSSTVEFTLSVTPSSENLTSVNIGGVSQLKTAYSITGNVITFSSAPAAGAAIEVTTLSGGGGGSGIENGTSNVAIPVANGNVTISVAGTDNVAVISAAGITVTGNITGNYILGNGSQLTGIETVSSELVNGSKTFGLAANGIVSMPEAASFFDANQEYVAADAHVLDEFDTTQYRTAKYIVQATNIDAENSIDQVHSTEVLLTHNGANTFMTEYATLITSNVLITLDSYIANGNAVLEATTLAANTRVDFFRVTLIPGLTVPILDLEGDLMTETGTEDLNVGEGAEDLNS